VPGGRGRHRLWGVPPPRRVVHVRKDEGDRPDWQVEGHFRAAHIFQQQKPAAHTEHIIRQAFWDENMRKDKDTYIN
jgi:hypothetical protein